MTKQKQLSHLSFAAIMLVFAALPALAQTGSDNQTAVATTSTSVESDQLAALRAALRKDRANESAGVVAPAVAEKQSAAAKQPSFSLNQFMKSATEPTMIIDTKVFDSTSLDKPAFTDSSAKSIQFVPSRGPKFPW